MKLLGRLNAWFPFPFYMSGFIHIIFIIKVAEIWHRCLALNKFINHFSQTLFNLVPWESERFIPGHGAFRTHPRWWGILELTGTWVAVYLSGLCMFLNKCEGTKINIRILLRCYLIDVTSMPSGRIGFCDVCYIRTELIYLSPVVMTVACVHKVDAPEL